MSVHLTVLGLVDCLVHCRLVISHCFRDHHWCHKWRHYHLLPLRWTRVKISQPQPLNSQPLFSPGQTYMSPGLHSYQSGISSLPGPLSTSDQPLSSGSSLMSQMEPLSPTASHFNSGDHQSASTSQPLFSQGQTFMSPGLHSYQRGTSLPGVQPLSTGQSLMPLSASSNQQPFSSRQAMLSSTGDSNLVLNYLAIIFHLNHHFI